MQHLLNGRKGHHDYGRKQETGNHLATGFGTRGLQPLHGNAEPHLPPQQQPQKEAAGGWYHLFETRAEAHSACRTGKRKERPQLPDHARCVDRHYPDPLGHQNVLNTIKTARNDLLLSFRAVSSSPSTVTVMVSLCLMPRPMTAIKQRD